MERWPNFFIVGSSKAGTTSIHEYLNKIPGIFMSPIKEPHYFSRNDIPKNNPLLHPIKDTIKYLSLFKKVKNEKIIGESSVSYLTSIEAPNLIHKKIPDARILISLRDPVERAFSAYFDHKRRGRLKISLSQELKNQFNATEGQQKPSLPLQNGLYFENVKRYLDIFGPEQVKIIIFEEWTINIISTIEKILKFLGVEYTIHDFQEEIHNPFNVPRGPVAQLILGSGIASKISTRYLSSSSRKFITNLLLKKQSKPKMREEDKKTLTNFYREDVKKLQSLLGRNLPWPNFENH